jgi:hypothetical protein
MILAGSYFAAIQLHRTVLFTRFTACFEAAWRGGYIFSSMKVGSA